MADDSCRCTETLDSLTFGCVGVKTTSAGLGYGLGQVFLGLHQ